LFHETLPFFARIDDVAFWIDRERVKTLIELYEHYESLWNVRCKDYKNIVKKKTAKVTVGKHFGWSGMKKLLQLKDLIESCTWFARAVYQTPLRRGSTLPISSLISLLRTPGDVNMHGFLLTLICKYE
jgi:hypothetical protein